MSELPTDAIEACIYGNETGEVDEFGFPKKIMDANRQLRALLDRIEKLEKEVQIHRRHNTDTAITALIEGGLDCQ